MIGEKLQEIRESKGMNKKEFAAFLGLKYTTYNNYETEAREPASDFLILISEKFDVSIDYLLGLKDNSSILHSYQLKSDEYECIKKYRSLDDAGRQHVDTVLDWESARSTAAESLASQVKELAGQIDSLRQFQDHHRYITYYYSVSAGTGQVIFDDVYAEKISIPNEPQYSRVAYAVKVSGHSMEPLYKDGCCLLIEPACEIEPGEIGVFNVDGQAFVKKFDHGELVSLNPDYKNIPLTEDARCMGRVKMEYLID